MIDINRGNQNELDDEGSVKLGNMGAKIPAFAQCSESSRHNVRYCSRCANGHTPLVKEIQPREYE